MKRSLSSAAVTDVVCNSSTDVTQTQRGKREVYAVFETVVVGFDPDKVNYLIYKLDPAEDAGDLVECAGGAKDVMEFRQPLAALKLGEYPSAMAIFSLGSKIYFCGGFECVPRPQPVRVEYSSKAYMFDAASKQGIQQIASMNSPKPIPFFFGPVNQHQFYVFSPSRTKLNIYIEPSMEILDTDKDTWEVVSLPSWFNGLIFNSGYALCGSNIMLSSSHGGLTVVYVYSTISGAWRVLRGDRIPFDSARNVGVVEKLGHILLGARPNSPLPELFSCKAKNDDADLIGPFESLGEVEGFSQIYKPVPEFLFGCGWGSLMGCFYFDCHSICLVRTLKTAKHKCQHNYHFLIDIFDISYIGQDDTKVKAKFENVLQYKYVSKTQMLPKHFFSLE